MEAELFLFRLTYLRHTQPPEPKDSTQVDEFLGATKIGTAWKYFASKIDGPEIEFLSICKVAPLRMLVVKCDGDHGGPPCDDPKCWQGHSTESMPPPPQPPLVIR